MQNPRGLICIEITFNQASGHLNADAQHRLGDFHVLALQEHFGILGEIQSNQRTFVLSPSQLNSAVWQLDNF
jgi:hypothetical protein